MQCFTDTAAALAGLREIWLDVPGAEPAGEAHRVERAAVGRSGELRVSLAGVSSRASAEALIGRSVRARVDELPPAGEGELYGFELVGFRAETREGRALGRVADLWSTGAAPLLVIEGEGGVEHLVPSALLLAIERGERRVVVDAIPGLLAGPS